MESIVETEQKLAAIMFTDIISFSVMTGKNEKKALSILQAHNTLLSEQFGKYNGNVIKELGDGYLAEFQSSLESVNAAIAIQHALYIHNSTCDMDDQIRIRIGIHLGDIVKTDTDDILGDGVNIASRIEPHSEPNGGGLCFSQQIYDQVHNKINYNIESIGKKKLKGITKPHELYRVILPFQQSDIRSVGERKVKNSIAVLPFVNMSSDTENEYFADGITEELLNVMAKEKELKVISRTSAFSYKGKNLPTKKIGRELNVEHILEGSVRFSGDKVRITAQLIQVADSFHLWSETYDRTLDDIFTIQDEISSTILTELLDRIVTCENCKMDNIEAFNLYHKGRHHWNQRTESEIVKGIECFNKALKEDPTLSVAYTGLVDSWSLLVQMGNTKKEKVIPKCWEAIHKAEELGDTSAELYTSHSAVLSLEGKSQEVIEYLLTAIEQNPNYATAHQWLSVQYYEKQEYQIALEEIEKALSLDPKSPIIHQWAADIYSKVGDKTKSLETLKELINISPGFDAAECQLGYQQFIQQYKWDEAEKYYADLRKSDHYKNNKAILVKLLNFQTLLYLYLNKKDKAINILEELENIDENCLDPLDITLKYVYIAEHSASLNNNENSIKYYTKLINMHPNDYWYWFAYVNLANSLIFAQEYDKALKLLNEVVLLIKQSDDSRQIVMTEYMIEYNNTLINIFNKDIENSYLGINRMKNMDVNLNYGWIPCHYLLSCLYFCLNDIDNGFKWYFKQVEIESCFDIINGRWCKNAYKDDRYISLLKEMKLYDNWKDSL